MEQKREDGQQRLDSTIQLQGKTLTVSGAQDQQYTQALAAYLNGKWEECRAFRSFKKQSPENQNLLIQLNIADDLFQSRQKYKELQEELQKSEDKIRQLRHQLVEWQMRGGALPREAAPLAGRAVREESADQADGQMTIEEFAPPMAVGAAPEAEPDQAPGEDRRTSEPGAAFEEELPTPATPEEAVPRAEDGMESSEKACEEADSKPVQVDAGESGHGACERREDSESGREPEGKTEAARKPGDRASKAQKRSKSRRT